MAAYLWDWAPESAQPEPAGKDALPESTALAKDLKGRGWTFVGPTTVYAFMQSVGMVNDHLEACFARPECEAERAQLPARPHR